MDKNDNYIFGIREGLEYCVSTNMHDGRLYFFLLQNHILLQDDKDQGG